MKDTVKNLLIDFGGVLIDLDKERCVQNFRNLEMGDVAGMLDSYQQKGLFMLHEQGQISSDEFRSELRKLSHQHVSDAQIDEAWNSFLVDIPRAKLDLLLELRKHYHVYLLSNTNDIHWKWACEHVFVYGPHRVEDYFERLYLSFQMGMTKPDPALFRAVLQDVSLQPEETFFIDDSVANCEVARSLGIECYTPEPHEDWSHLFIDQLKK